MTLDLVLIGYGHVAKRFVALLAEQRTALARRHGLTTRVVGIATRRHGQAYAAAGLPSYPPNGPPKLYAKAEVGHCVPSTPDFLRDALSKSRAAARQRRLVVIETTTLDIARGEPATSHIRAALTAARTSSRRTKVRSRSPTARWPARPRAPTADSSSKAR